MATTQYGFSGPWMPYGTFTAKEQAAAGGGGRMLLLGVGSGWIFWFLAWGW